MNTNNYSIYSATTYSECLRSLLLSKRGVLSEVARKIRCQPSYLSQVIAEKAHLSLEHAISICEHFSFSKDEQRYFLLLVQKGRAGNQPLAEFFESELKEIRQKREQINNRILVQDGLKLEDQVQYYSSWLYTAAHILSALPNYNSRQKIQDLLRIQSEELDQILSFLISRGLIEETGSNLKIGSKRIHLPSQSHQIPRHHANWRLRAIEACNRNRPADLHYSGLIGISKKDGPIAKELYLKFISELEKLLKQSEPEEPFVVALDFFHLESSP